MVRIHGILHTTSVLFCQLLTIFCSFKLCLYFERRHSLFQCPFRIRYHILRPTVETITRHLNVCTYLILVPPIYGSYHRLFLLLTTVFFKYVMTEKMQISALLKCFETEMKKIVQRDIAVKTYLELNKEKKSNNISLT